MLVAAAGYAFLCSVMYFRQTSLLYSPSPDVVDTPLDIGLAYEDVLFRNALGTQLHGWFVPREGARYVVLFSHGNAGNISGRLEFLRIFNELGLSVFIYDYSGFGRSEGVPSEEGTRADSRAAWEWLTSEGGFRPEDVILFGRSLGGAVTAELAGHLQRGNEQFAGLVIESSFTSITDMGAHLYPWLPVRRLMRFEYDSVASLTDVRVPALFIHSTEDDLVPYELGRELFESYGGPKKMVDIRGGHGRGYLDSEPIYAKAVGEFLIRLKEGG